MNIEVLTRNTTSLVLNGRPIVRAATNLRRNSATELIDVNFLAQRRSSVIQYIEVADAQGRLYCVNASVNPSCWVKIIKLAEGYQSCNVMLMMSGNGIVLKIIKPIIPGEPLLLWFSISILALVNIPFLMPINMPGAFMYPPFNDNYRLHFQGEINCYVCHICNSRFEFPNHLKLHLAFKCNTPNYDHLWIILAREFNMIPESCRIIETFIPDESLFGFNLSTSIQIVPVGTSPDLMEMTNSHSPNVNDSQSSSNPSPSSSTHVDSPSPNSSIQVLPMHTKLGQYHSAFKPYMKNQDILPPRVMDHLLVSHDQYQIQPPAVRPDLHAAHMETIVSNLGKSKQGHLCIYCGKVYSRKYGLKIHIRTHTGYKPLKCKYCLRSFGDPSNLNKHVRLHAEGETPYKCDICGKVLVRRRDLERHIKSRHENVDQVSDTFPEDIDVVTQ